MNFSFLIDNSLTSCQLQNTGVQLLDIGKNAVEYFVKKRIKPESRNYDTFHLLTTQEKDMILSSWVNNDNQHLINTVKFIQPDFQCDLPQALRMSFYNLNRYRVLNGSDNLHGGRDCMKLDPGVVLLFTSCDDLRVPMQILEMIKQKSLGNRWDQKLYVYLVQPAGYESSDQGMLHFQLRNEQLQDSPFFRAWQQIVHLVGRGSVTQVFTQEGLNNKLDEQNNANEFSASISLNLTQLPASFNKGHDKASDSLEVEKFELNLKKGEEYLQNNLNTTTIKDYIIKSYFQQITFWQGLKSKSGINVTIFTKVYLPETIVLPSRETDIVEFFPGIPNYYVDFTRCVKAPNSALQYQDVNIQEKTLSEYCAAICSNISNREIFRFPVFYIQQQIGDMEEERSIPLLVGLLTYNSHQDKIELQLQTNLNISSYFPSFYNLSSIITQIKSYNFNQRLAEKNLIEYFKKVPNYYQPCIKKFFMELPAEQIAQRNWQYMTEEPYITQHQNQIKIIQNRILNIRKQSDELQQKSKQLHSGKRSHCCPWLSDNYELVSQNLIDKPFRAANLKNFDLHRDKHLVQSMFDYPPCKSSQPPTPTMNQQSLRSNRIGEDEIEYGFEPAYCGNPWKLFKKFYQDGQEKKQNEIHEGSTSEDLMLTKLDQHKEAAPRQVKNKRRNFIRLSKRKQLVDQEFPINTQTIEQHIIDDATTVNEPEIPKPEQRRLYISRFEASNESQFVSQPFTVIETQEITKSPQQLHQEGLFLERLIRELWSGIPREQIEELVQQQEQSIQKRAMDKISSFFEGS